MRRRHTKRERIHERTQEQLIQHCVKEIKRK